MDTADRAVEAVTIAGETTRAELGELLGLSRATVARTVDRLLADGVLAEGAAAEAAGPGRPARALRLADGPRRLVAVIVWSSGLLRIGVGTGAGALLAHETVAGRGDTLDTLLEPAAAAIDTMLGGARLAGLVFGVPAPFRPGAGLPPLPEIRDLQRQYPPWLATDPTARLQARFGAPVLIENDANLGALGEQGAGAGAGIDTSVYVKLGVHAVGAGLIVGGSLHRGAAGFAGELAHVQVREDGPLCTCGGRGCLVRTLDTELFAPRTFAAEDAPASRRFLRDVGRTLGRPLADLTTLLNPGAIVLDGALGAAAQQVAAGVREAIDRHAAPVAADTVDVLVGELGEQAELAGGLRLWREDALARVAPTRPAG